MLSRIIKILPVLLLLLTSCNRGSEISINQYSYSDSIIHSTNSTASDLNYKSEVLLCLLSTSSNDTKEQAVVKAINQSILDQISSEYKNETPDSICHYIVRDNLQEMSDLANKRYGYEFNGNEIESESNDETAYTFYNNFTTDCRIGLGDSVVCYTYNSSSYLGGAHPGNYSFALTYSLRDGNVIHPNRLFSNSDRQEMLKRIVSKLINRHKVKNEEELQGMGFEVTKLSDNILLDKDSITFHYDSYTIAPWVYGDIDVRFSYEEVKDIFKWTKS